MPALLQNIRTNVITGFLGVGKTTTILNLMRHKPSHEKWAVLVNEAGKVGVDGSILQQSGITVSQVPGGCMCCATGLPMQIAVNRLLLQARPDRLLIEPSGMGHPRNILRTLSASEYEGVLDQRACICLLDPRKLDDERYRDNELFRDQIAVADILVANKTDLCSPDQRTGFEAYAHTLPVAKLAYTWVEHGMLDPAWLDYPHQATARPAFYPVGGDADALQVISIELSATQHFQLQCLLTVLAKISCERIKGIVATPDGAVLINNSENQSSITAIDSTDRYVLEFMSTQPLDQQQLRQQILSCLQ